eukprot:Nk52_evm26s1360 gene=Nk52_evmTU26s1360
MSESNTGAMSKASSLVSYGQIESNYELEGYRNESSYWNRKLQLLKEVVYRALKKVAYNNTLPQWATVIWLVIETLQLISFALVDGVPWNETWAGWLKEICGALRFTFIFDISNLLVIAICGFGFIMILATYASGLYIFKREVESSSSIKFYQWLKPFFITSSMTLSTLLYTPFLTTFVAAVYCNQLSDSDSCYSGISIVGMILGVFGFVLLIPLAIYVNATTVRAFPPKSPQMARCHGKGDLYILAFKTLLCIIDGVLHGSGGGAWISIGVILIGGLGLSYYIAMMLPYMNFMYNRIRTSQLWFLTWAGLCMLITKIQNDKEEKGGIFLFYFAIPFVIVVASEVPRLRRKVVLQKRVNKCSSPNEIEMKVRFLLFEADMDLNKLRWNEADTANDDGDKEELLCKMNDIFSKGIQRFPSSSLLYIMWAQYELAYTKKGHVALRLLRKASERNPTFDENFLIYRITSEIQFVFEQDEQNRKTLEYLEFQRTLEETKTIEINIMKAQQNFLEEMLRPTPQVSLLHRSSDQIYEGIKLGNSYYRKMIQLNPDSVSVRRMYGSFLVNCINDFSSANSLFQKADEIEANIFKQKSGSENEVDVFNDENPVFVISGADERVGEIVRANMSASRIFGYGNAELVGSNISTIIPFPFNKSHDGWIRRYLNGGNPGAINKTRQIFAVHKSGFLMYMRLSVKEVFGVSQNTIFLGVFEPIKTTTEYILLNENNLILSCTTKLASVFNTTATEVHSGTLDVTNWIPDYNDCISLIFSPEGYSLQLFSHILDQSYNFVIKGSAVPYGDGAVMCLECSQPDEGQIDTRKAAMTTMEYDDGVTSYNNAGGYDNGYCPSPSSPNEKMVAFQSLELEEKDSKSSHKDENLKESINEIASSNVGSKIFRRDEDKDSVCSKESLSSLNNSKKKNYANIQQYLLTDSGSTTKSVKHLKIVFLLTYILTLLLAIATYISMTVEVQNLNDTLHKIDDLGLGKIYMSMCAWEARTLVLLQEKYVAYDTVDNILAKSRESLKANADKLENIAQNVIPELSDPSFVQNALVNEQVLRVVIMEGTTPQVTTTSLRNGIMELATKSRLLAELPLASITMEERNAFYIITNANKNLLVAMNNSIAEMNKQTEDITLQIEITNEVMLGVSLGLLVFCLLFVVVPTLYRVDRNRNDVLNICMLMPKQVVKRIHRRVKERRAILEGIDEGDEEMFEEEINIDSKELQKSVKKNNARKRFVRSNSLSRNIILKILIFLVITGAFYAVYTILNLVEEHDQRVNTPNLVNWQLDRSPIVVELMNEMRDVEGNFDDIFFAKEIGDLETSDFLLKSAQNALVYGSPEKGIYESEFLLNDRNMDLFFENGCVYASTTSGCSYYTPCCPTILNGLQSNGLHPSLLTYVQLVLSELHAAHNATTQAEITAELNDQSSIDLISFSLYVLEPNLEVSNTFYFEYIDNRNDEVKLIELIALIVYLIVAVLLYIILYHPMFPLLNLNVKKSRSIFLLVPYSILVQLDQDKIIDLQDVLEKLSQ